MVSKASEDLPEPERPVMTMRLSRGSLMSIPLRLCSRAPRTIISRFWLGFGVIISVHGSVRARRRGGKVGKLASGRGAHEIGAARLSRKRPARMAARLSGHLSVSPTACQSTIVQLEHKRNNWDSVKGRHDVSVHARR